MGFYTTEAGKVRVGRIALTVIGALFAIYMVASFYSVGYGEKAVVFNKMSGAMSEADSGIHFRPALVYSVTKYNVQQNIYSTTADGASKDLQEIHAEIVVRYHPDAAFIGDTHLTFGPNYAAKVITPGVQEAVKSVTATHLAANLVVNRSIVKAEITEALRTRLAESHITLDELSITDFDFSAQFNVAIENKVTAEQNALAALNKLKQVEYEAQQKIAEAQGQAEAARLISDQLEQNPGYLTFLMIQRWNGEVPLYVGSGGENFLLPMPSQ